MKNIEVQEKEKVIICGDNDGKESNTYRLTTQIGNTLKLKGVSTIAIRPEKEGYDFNDVLKEEGKKSVEKYTKEALSKNIDKNYTKTSELNYADFENEKSYDKAYEQASKFEEKQYKKSLEKKSPEEKAIEKIKNIKSNIKERSHGEAVVAEKANLERELEKYYTEISKNKELTSKIMDKNPDLGKEIKQIAESIKHKKSMSYGYKY